MLVCLSSPVRSTVLVLVSWPGPFSVLVFRLAWYLCPISNCSSQGCAHNFWFTHCQKLQKIKRTSGYDEQSTQSKQRVTTIVLAALAIIFLCLRLLARRVKKIHLGADDTTLIVGLGSILLALNMARADTQVLSLWIDRAHLSSFVFAFEPLYITTAGVIKLSVLLMYYRVFPVRYVKIGGLILGTVTLAWVISIDFLAIFQCSPIAKAYNPTLAGHCISLKGALIGNGVPNFVTDILILALPSKLIWGLQASLWQRVSFIAVFLTGSFVVFASIYRFSLIFIFDMNDVAWTLADAQTWCVVELAAGVISACLPTTAPLVRICTKGLVFTAQSVSMSNLTQSEKRVVSRAWVTTHSINAENTFNASTDGARRATSNENYVLEEMNPGHRGSSHLKGKGWTVISAEHDSD